MENNSAQYNAELGEILMDQLTIFTRNKMVLMDRQIKEVIWDASIKMLKYKEYENI